MKTKQLFNKYTKISSLYITKEQAHAENYNPEDSYSANIFFKKHHLQPAQSIQHQPQLSASSPFILITPPKLPVNFNLPLYFNRRRGADGEGYVKGTGTSLQDEAGRALLPALIRFRLV